MYNSQLLRRGGRVVDCTGLENRRWFIPTQGSNPCPSATLSTALQHPIFLSKSLHTQYDKLCLHYLCLVINGVRHARQIGLSGAYAALSGTGN